MVFSDILSRAPELNVSSDTSNKLRNVVAHEYLPMGSLVFYEAWAERLEWGPDGVKAVPACVIGPWLLMQDVGPVTSQSVNYVRVDVMDHDNVVHTVGLEHILILRGTYDRSEQ